MKRTTRRKVNQAALYLALLLFFVLLASVADWGAIKNNFLDVETMKGMFPDVIVVGARNTLVYTGIAFLGGLVLALFLALSKLSPVAPYRWLATGYIEFFRSLPALVVILFMGYGVPIAFQWRPPGGTTGAGVLALIIVSAAYMAETLRAGIQAVPKGQAEAARSLGMSAGRTTISVVLPQAFRIVIPPLTNEFVLLLKDSSLLYVLGMAVNQRELTSIASDGMTYYSNATSLVVAAVMYLVITLPLTRLVAQLERRQQRAR